MLDHFVEKGPRPGRWIEDQHTRRSLYMLLAVLIFVDIGDSSGISEAIGTIKMLTQKVID